MQITTSKILYEYGDVQKIIDRYEELHGVRLSDQTVRNALRFVTRGEQPEELRRIALEEFKCPVKTETTGA